MKFKKYIEFFNGNRYDRMSKVQQYFASNVRNQYTTGNLDQRIDDVLQKVKNLSIAGIGST